MDSLRWSGAGSHPQENALIQGTKKHCLGDCTISAPYAPKKMPLTGKYYLIYWHRGSHSTGPGSAFPPEPLYRRQPSKKILRSSDPPI